MTVCFELSNSGEDIEIFVYHPEFDLELLKRFRVILGVLSIYQFKARILPFQKYTRETAELFVKRYNWYYMPTSLHEILLHAHKVMDILDLPIGMYSEEAQEARNKEVKKFRESHSRKTSR